MLLRIIPLSLLLFYSCAQGELLAKPLTKAEIQAYMSQFEEALECVAKQHVAKPSYQTLVNSAISGMLTSLDDYSRYMIGEEGEEYLKQTSGRFGGIGIEMTCQKKGEILIIAPIADLPAAKAGIKSGDKIIAVDGITIKELGYANAIKKIQGKPGTKVKLTIERDSTRDSTKNTIDYELVRVMIKTHPVKSQLDANIGYLRISRFGEGTAAELQQEVNNWIKEKRPLTGIILDLRDNPGGFLRQGIDISEYFLESGKIVGIKGRDDKIIMTKVNPYSNKAPKLPMVVLINKGSASSSEIVAAALQDNDRAVLVGTNSFGKGTVQELIKTKKYDAMIKVTIALYCSPKEKFIDKKGVIPDVIVEQENIEDEASSEKKPIVRKEISKQLIKEDDVQYKKAREILTSNQYIEIMERKKAHSAQQPQK
jgi:carboxyl-terminal processing protease